MKFLPTTSCNGQFVHSDIIPRQTRYGGVDFGDSILPKSDATSPISGLVPNYGIILLGDQGRIGKTVMFMPQKDLFRDTFSGLSNMIGLLHVHGIMGQTCNSPLLISKLCSFAKSLNSERYTYPICLKYERLYVMRDIRRRDENSSQVAHLHCLRVERPSQARTHQPLCPATRFKLRPYFTNTRSRVFFVPHYTCFVYNVARVAVQSAGLVAENSVVAICYASSSYLRNPRTLTLINRDVDEVQDHLRTQTRP